MITQVAYVSSEAVKWLELAGAFAFATSGAMMAVRARLDWLGAVVLAVVTSTGGGTLRDLLLGSTPVLWIRHPKALVIAFVAAFVVIALSHRRPQSRPDSWRVLLVADSAGLAAFTTVGTLIALDAGVGPWMSIVLGVLSGTGGGVLRDVMTGQLPLVLRGRIYALAATAGSALLVFLTSQGVNSQISQWSGIVVILSLRYLAIQRKWSVPTLNPPEDAAISE